MKLKYVLILPILILFGCSITAQNIRIGQVKDLQAKLDSIDVMINLKSPINNPSFTGTVYLPNNVYPINNSASSLGYINNNFLGIWSLSWNYTTNAGIYIQSLQMPTISQNAIITFPNKSGTVALTSDIIGGGGGLFEIDSDGNLTPNDEDAEDTFYELDGDGNIQPL